MAKRPPPQGRDKVFANYEDKKSNSIFENGLKKVFHSKELVDCKFLIGQEKQCFYAHKFVLAMASEVFKRLLYSDASPEPISIPDVDPHIFESLLRYIYLNEPPSEDLEKNKAIDQESLIIQLWYVTSKYRFSDLSKKYYDMMKINVNNFFLVYVSCKRLLKCGTLQQDSDARTLISRCLKVFSVKTADVLAENRFTYQNTPAVYLKKMFATEYMSIESELDLFIALQKYANEHGWTPNTQFLLEKGTDGGELLTPFQKHVREALKQLRYLAMTLKEFDSIPAKSGFFTEFEVKTIRDRIADQSAQCVSIAGFATQTTKKRYELLHLTYSNHTQQRDEKKNEEKLSFSVGVPKGTLGVTEPFTLGGITWQILIYVREVSSLMKEYTFYLKCDVPVAEDWRCYAQLDIGIELLSHEKKQLFENIPWYCFKCDANYSQMKPLKLESEVKTCHMTLALSPHHVSYKNKQSNVSGTYGKDVRDYE